MNKTTPKAHPVTPPTLISVINQSKRVSNDDVARMTSAVSKQLAHDVSLFYGMVPALEFVQPGGKPSPGGCPCYLSDEPDQPNAAGYHYEDATGLAIIKVFLNPTLDNGGTALVGPNSVSVTLSHECMELLGDAPANKWVDGPKGHDFAYELADPVEGDAYVIDGVSVSNFVLQAFFDPQASKGSKFDFLQRLKAPFSMTSGGYQITRTEPGKVSQIFADHHYELAAPGIHVHFGADVPEWKRVLKTKRAAAKRGRR